MKLPLAFILAAAAFAAPARAQNLPEEKTGLQAFRAALTPPERAELDGLISLFSGHVQRRRSQGWHHGEGVMGNGFVAASNFMKAKLPGGMTPDEDQGFNIPRLACEDRIEALRSERDNSVYEREHAAPGATAARAKSKAAIAASNLHKCEVELQRTMGTCQDWATDVCYMLTTRGRPSAFENAQTRWASGGYEHAACRVRLKSDPKRSVVFDAWLHGNADVFAADNWPMAGQLFEFEPVASAP